jgi:uncharacterized RDD family membrane protein YckC
MDQDLMTFEDLSIPVDSTPVVDLEGAGFWIRFLARIIDLGIHYLVGLIIGFLIGIIVGVLGALLGTATDVLIERLQNQNFIDYGLAIIGAMIYHTMAEGIHGSTPGKLICGLVVIKENRTPCGFFPALWRSLAYFIDALFFGLPAALSMNQTIKRQRLGDRWAKTMVVKTQHLTGIMEKRSPARFVLGFLAAVTGDALFLIVGPIIRLIG